jgi:hypothetical protein
MHIPSPLPSPSLVLILAELSCVRESLNTLAFMPACMSSLDFFSRLTAPLAHRFTWWIPLSGSADSDQIAHKLAPCTAATHVSLTALTFVVNRLHIWIQRVHIGRLRSVPIPPPQSSGRELIRAMFVPPSGAIIIANGSVLNKSLWTCNDSECRSSY